MPHSALTNYLNDKQKSAVTADNHHILVLAGAGSGKTRVLTHRLAWLIATGKADIYSIMAVTFTNKAAKEMVLRIQSLPGLSNLSYARMKQMWVGTFHGICVRFLQMHFHEAGLKTNPQIIDNSDQLSAIKNIVKTLEINTDDFPVRDFQFYINARKEEGLRAGEGEIFDADGELKNKVYTEYQNYCNKENLLDFGEMLLRTYEVLKRNQILREHYQQRFKHILVDEFQDTNTLQYELIKMLSGNNTAIFAVGDDDQSIYGFRGAKVENIRHFEKNYSHNNVIRLEQSYRSCSNILDAANKLIASNNERLGKNLWTEQKAGEPIKLYPAYNDEDEARWVFGQIQHLASQGVAWNEIAILYRINAHSRAFEHQAVKANIPYRVYGGFRFYDRAEIRNLLSFLRLIVNPDDEMSFLRVVNFPPRAIGERALESLQLIAKEKNLPLMQSIYFLEGRSKASLLMFAELINYLSENINNLSLSEIINLIIDKAEIKAFYDKQRDGGERLENLEELINAANLYEEELITLPDDESISTESLQSNLAILAPDDNNGKTKIANFLNDAVLDSAQPEESNQSAINLMTIHSAKGLEFSGVFIAGLEQGTFPHEFNQDIEEERRLMYVAITRAKKYLHLSYAHQRMLHGKIRFNIPSLFLTEIPQELIQGVATQANPNSIRGFYHNQNNFDDIPNSKFSTNSFKTPSSLYSKNNSVSDSSNQPFLIGEKVRHNKFGDGFVQRYEGKNDDARILISFGTLGQKWLLLNLAKLERV